jgi:hypothetical protein
MNRARDHRTNDPAYIEWQRNRQAELDAEKAAADIAQAAAEATDPVKAFQKASDAEAEAQRDLVLNGVLSESVLPGERVRGRAVNEVIAGENFKAWTQQESTFKKYMFETFYAALKRNDLAPIANNFGTMHRLLLQYNCYTDEPVQEVAPVVEELPHYTASEQAVIDHQKYCEEIIGHDESGKGWTMEMVDALPSKEMLRLLRLFEQGHRGSNLLTIRREILDIKQQQEAERQKIAAEEIGGN